MATSNSASPPNYTCVCGKHATSLEFSCKGCEEFYYCNENCRRNHWASAHKEECTKMVQLEKLYTNACSAKDLKAVERMTDACVKALGSYLIKSLRIFGSPIEYSTFYYHVDQVVQMLMPVTNFDEQFSIISGALDEAERLRQGGHLVSFGILSRKQEVEGSITFLRASLFVAKGKILINRGDLKGSEKMFDHGRNLAEGIQGGPAGCDVMDRASIEGRIGVAYGECSMAPEAITALEETYVRMLEHCSPDAVEVQQITKVLVKMYRYIGDHEKADHFTRTFLENIENRFPGQYRMEIGYALESLAQGALVQAGTEVNVERKNALLDEFESHMRRALLHLKHCEEDSLVVGPRVAYAKRRMYGEQLHVLLSVIATHKRYDSSDVLDLSDEYIDFCRTTTKTLPPGYSEPALPAEKDLYYGYLLLFLYFGHRQRTGGSGGRSLSEPERALLARRKEEYQSLRGLSKRQFDAWHEDALSAKVSVFNNLHNYI